METGIKGRAETVVVPENTAVSAGSGNLEVFATPHMIALMEKASFESVIPFLEEGRGTVGTRIEVSHISATPIGMKVTAESELVSVDGRKLIFSVKAYDEAGLIGEGMHERFIIESDKFMLRCASKLET
jgi:fluoroacetyl-CoA thioesterase